MNYARFFGSLFLGSVICLPIMTIVGREVDELEVLDDFLWVPVLVAILSLLMKVLLEKKRN